MSKFLLCDVPITKNDDKPYGGLNIFSPAIKQQAIDLYKLCQYYGKINKNHRVLDFGCGTGRILSRFDDTYKHAPIGFDCCWRFVSKCRDVGLRTEYLSIQHPEFNPYGYVDPTSFLLPFKNNYFDRIIGIALLNHQDMERAERIISESLRIVKKGGIVLFTAFMINPQSITQLRYDQCVFKFKEKTADWWVTDYERPYLNCALDETIIRRTIIQNRGQVVEPIYYGHWRQIVNTPTGHDLLVIRKV